MQTFVGSDVLSSILVITAELGVVVSVIFFILNKRIRRREKEEIELLRRLVEMVRKREPVRMNFLHNLLLENQKMDEERATAGAKRLLGAEKAVYNKVIKIFSRVESDALLTLNQEIEQVTEHYQRVINDAIGVINDFKSEDQAAGAPETVESLRAENARLGQELDEAVKTIESMMKEYMSMYGGGGKKDGVKHLENQLHQLNQKIRRQVVVPMVGDANSGEEDADPPIEDDMNDLDIGDAVPEPDVIDLDSPEETDK